MPINFPQVNQPLTDKQGKLTSVWQYFLQNLFSRTGGNESNILNDPGNNGVVIRTAPNTTTAVTPLPIVDGGTGLSTLGVANRILSVNGGGTALAYTFATNQNLQTVDSVTFAQVHATNGFSGSGVFTNFTFVNGICTAAS